VKITIFDVIGDTAVYDIAVPFALCHFFVTSVFHQLKLTVRIRHQLITIPKIVIVLLTKWLFNKIEEFQVVKRAVSITGITNSLPSVLNSKNPFNQPTIIFNRNRIIQNGVNNGKFLKNRSPPKTHKTSGGVFEIYRSVFNAPQRLSNTTGNSSRDGYSFKHRVYVYGTASKKRLSHINKKYWEEKYSTDRKGI
jgi:hypothetical protein